MYFTIFISYSNNATILIGPSTLLFRQNGRNFIGDNSMGLVMSLLSFTK